MNRQAVSSRANVVLASLILALGLAGVALARPSGGSVQIDVTVLDGKLTVSPTTFAPGKVTFVAVNKGKLSHALAIMGTGLEPKRTTTIASGKSAQLTVTVGAGMYHVWDPVRSSMSHATMLTVRTPSSSSAHKSSGSATSGSTITAPAMGSGSGSGSSSGSGADMGSGMGMDGC